MAVLKQIVLFAPIFVGLGLGSERKVLQNEDLKRMVGRNWDAEQAIFRKLESTSAPIRLFWKNEKSTPPSSFNYKSAENGTLLDFDDIKTTSPLTNLTSYKNMSFTSYKVLSVPFAINSSFLDPQDIDTTFSSPNAILGSTSFSPHSTLPRIFVSSSCSRTTSSPVSYYHCPNEFPPRFQPISMRVKPTGFLLKGKLIVMEIYAWELDGREVANVYGATIVWGSGNGGFTKELRLSMGHWGRGKDGKRGGG